MALLHLGDKFPDLTLTVPGGGILQIPGSLGGHFSVVLFFRGAWCPYCNAQLRAFQRAKDTLAEVNTAVVALSRRRGHHRGTDRQARPAVPGRPQRRCPRPGGS